MPNSLDLAINRLDQNSQAIRDIAGGYHLYGGVFYYHPSEFPNSDLNRLYVVCGSDPRLNGKELPKDIRPDEIIRRNGRNNTLFYTDYWAMELKPDNSNLFHISDDLMEFLKGSEAVHVLYGEYGVPVPDKLRLSELNMLITINDAIEDSKTSPALKEKYRKDLTEFFKNESNERKREWNDYYRSEHFPDDGGAIQKKMNFSKRNEQRVELSTLMRVNGDVQKIELQEHEYQVFKQFLKDCYPSVTYAIEDMHPVDHKLRNSPNDPPGTPKYVTSEEYDQIKKERFAKDGFSALSDLQVTNWKFRTVYYKEVDEPIIAAVVNDIRTKFAKPDMIDEVRRGGGELKHIAVPSDNFANFVSLAKANNLTFYIDNRGSFFKPNLEEYHVIYNSRQQELVMGIQQRLFSEKVSFSHAVSDSQRANRELDKKIDRIKLEQSMNPQGKKELRSSIEPEL